MAYISPLWGVQNAIWEEICERYIAMGDRGLCALWTTTLFANLCAAHERWVGKTILEWVDWIGTRCVESQHFVIATRQHTERYASFILFKGAQHMLSCTHRIRIVLKLFTNFVWIVCIVQFELTTSCHFIHMNIACVHRRLDNFTCDWVDKFFVASSIVEWIKVSLSRPEEWLGPLSLSKGVNMFIMVLSIEVGNVLEGVKTLFIEWRIAWPDLFFALLFLKRHRNMGLSNVGVEGSHWVQHVHLTIVRNNNDFLLPLSLTSQHAYLLLDGDFRVNSFCLKLSGKIGFFLPKISFFLSLLPLFLFLVSGISCTTRYWVRALTKQRSIIKNNKVAVTYTYSCKHLGIFKPPYRMSTGGWDLYITESSRRGLVWL